MAEERYQYQRIEDYILKKMSTEENSFFESELKTDDMLKENYRLHLTEHEVMDHMIGIGIRNKFSDWKNNHIPISDQQDVRSVKPKSKNKRIWLITVIVLTIFFLIIYFFTQDHIVKVENISPRRNIISDTLRKDQFQMNSQDSMKNNFEQSTENPSLIKDPEKNPTTKSENPEQLLEVRRLDIAYVDIANEFYHEPEELYSRIRSEKIEPSDPFSNSIELFHKGKYKESLKILDQIQGKSNSNVQYLKGHNYFKLGRYEKAALMFTPMAKNQLLPLHDEARWILFLTYTAELPVSKGKWISLKNELVKDEDFGHQKELKSIILKLKN